MPAKKKVIYVSELLKLIMRVLMRWIFKWEHGKNIAKSRFKAEIHNVVYLTVLSLSIL